MDKVQEILLNVKRQIHERAIYPHNSGIEPYVSLKIVDAVIDSEIKKIYNKPKGEEK